MSNVDGALSRVGGPPAPESPRGPQEIAATGQLAEAAQQFESLLLNMMIKAMRESVPQSDLFGESSARDTYEMMRDQELAKSMSENGGVGFADMIVRQFSGREEEGLQSLVDMRQRLQSASSSYEQYGAAAAAPGRLDVGGDR